MRLSSVFILKPVLICVLLSIVSFASGQSYTSYFTGNAIDSEVIPLGGICLMGGGTENDAAMRWFLQRTNGGDVLVLRASGTDGYNNYMFNGLGVSVNSVETIVFHNRDASFDPYIHQRINQAEAVWFAGGDQWNYVSYWRETPIVTLINTAITERNIAIGGTSAGMAILGRYYFSAKNGTVGSATALYNPYVTSVTVDTSAFLNAPRLENVITDTHYNNPDRRGRHAVFMARLANDFGLKEVKGIACDEYTAVCIDNDGIARVYGGYPAYDDFAWFIQINCENDLSGPEVCVENQPLTWNRNSRAIKVYKVPGNQIGSNYFHAGNWQSGQGGQWQDWWVENGVLNVAGGEPLNCDPLHAVYPLPVGKGVHVFPNPVRNETITIESSGLEIIELKIYDITGFLRIADKVNRKKTLTLSTRGFPGGVYIIKVFTTGGAMTKRIVIL